MAAQVMVQPERALRLGFLGVGWIGRHRMQALLDTGLVEAAMLADASPEMVQEAAALAPEAELAAGLDEMLEAGLDGVVIATPSALHAGQAVQALESGTAVFCQKPLGRNAAEVRRVVDAARAADRLLGVDLSYRYTAGMRQIRELVAGGELGRIFALTRPGSTTGRWRAAAASSIWACIWWTWRCGPSVSRRSVASPPRCLPVAGRCRPCLPKSRTMPSRPSNWRAERWCGSAAHGGCRQGATR
jgi:hypothetical protein